MALIELRNISKSYFFTGLKVEVLKGIDLDLNENEFIAVMGPSGSGKSTLLNIIGCLDRPTQGIYLLEGEEIETKSDNELADIRKGKIGFIFQNFNLLPRFPAWKNVELPLLYSGVPARERRRRAIELLERFGLGGRVSHTPSELSGGEQQRVAIARAIINSPRIILADEPTGNLDSRSGAEVMELFLSLHKEGTAIIMVTHEMDIARKAQRIITIKDGVCSSGCF